MNKISMECDHSVGHLTAHYSDDEGVDSTYDLAMEFADDETLAVYLSHHEMAKEARVLLGHLASGLQAKIAQTEGEQ